MKVIALLGDENTGKSHTINVVYSFLLRDKYQQVPGVFSVLGDPKNEDIIDILIREETKVGIIGMGDLVGELKRCLLHLEQLGCDTVVCACRRKTNLEKVIINYQNHQFIKKTLSLGKSSNRIINAMDAETIIAAI